MNKDKHYYYRYNLHQQKLLLDTKAPVLRLRLIQATLAVFELRNNIIWGTFERYFTADKTYISALAEIHAYSRGGQSGFFMLRGGDLGGIIRFSTIYHARHRAPKERECF